MRAFRNLLSFLALLACAGGLQAEPTARLAGRITCGGQPVPGASVMVNRAWPIQGLAYYCPGCYLDCGKSARTNEQGEWSIEKLDDSLKFELLVVARGYAPERTGVFNPARGEAANVELKPRDMSALPREQVVTGRVIDLHGGPIEGAVVSPEMVYTETSGYGGMVDGLDQLAVTDEEGRFALSYAKACRAMDLSVSARGFAHTCFPSRSSGGKEHVLTVGEGGSVSGRLVRDGVPVPDVNVTLSVDQSKWRACFETQTIATDAEGRFLFSNVLPGQRCFVIASTEQLQRGCTAPKGLEVTADGEEVDLGDLPVIKGVRVAGRVLAPAGGALPAGAKLSLSNQTGWDGVTVDLAQDGIFVFPEVAPGEYSITLHAPGVYVSHRNASADKLNVNSLIGVIEQDTLGLEIETTTERPRRPRREAEVEVPELGGIEPRR